MPDYPFEEAFFLPYARQFRAALDMPLVLLGGINELATVEQALAEGFSFVAMARALLREPDLVSKMQRRHVARLAVHPLQQVHAHHLQRHPLRPRPARPAPAASGPNNSNPNNEDRHGDGRSDRPEAEEHRTTVRAMPLHVHESAGATDPLQVRPQFAQLGEISEVPKLRLARGRDAGRAPPTRSSTTSCCSTATPGSTWPRSSPPGWSREAEQLMAECSAKNMIDKDEYPQTAELERRCVNMLADLWHAPEEGGATGCSTTGSSEACMLGGLALKWRWRQRRQAAGKAGDRPNLVMGANVQVCWEKFCRYWDVEARLVPVGPVATCLTAETAVAHCDENTIGVVAVLGSTYDGAYEPVADIAAALDELAASSGVDVPIHVDGASGGFIAPFLDPELAWDFRLPRVHSINASGHKYGLVYPGVGWIIWRDQAALPDELVFNVDYLGGNMPTFALNFSRPGRAGRGPVLQLPAPRAPTATARCSRPAGTRRSGWPTRSATWGPTSSSPRATASPPSPSAIKDAPYTVYDVSDALRVQGWLVPAYTMPPALDHRRRAAHRGAQRLQPRPGQPVDRGPQTGRRPPARAPTSDAAPTSASTTEPRLSDRAAWERAQRRR